MGSVAVAALIVAISFFISFTLLYSESMDAQDRVYRAVRISDEIEKGYLQSSVKIVDVNQTGNNLTVTLLNDGKIVLNPYYLTIMVNGVPEKPYLIEVNGVRSSVWAPGEEVKVYIEYAGTVERLKVVTQYGTLDYYRA